MNWEYLQRVLVVHPDHPENGETAEVMKENLEALGKRGYELVFMLPLPPENPGRKEMIHVLAFFKRPV
jgi:hypothetical protein